MSEVNVYEQALVAVLNEAKSMGVEIDKLFENVSAGIMGNKPYVLVDSTHKADVIDVLRKAVNKLESRHAET
ncbi:hypothetical protein O5O45_06820 [Hahella aquimaris]|uniref:hypothetical protein n=1 Tax=Hahella sp. HNIBRBA332 TaxID=3015983 RepID=UPI00273B3EA8|nr:hypothetical protein [Hahella sp. HNIBRBA332]WLQ15627.1 hypothetical protein O5O45_06820 [Hahella sp. HNIBRBA332]